jgi:Ni/Co efflux regulator RcnB
MKNSMRLIGIALAGMLLASGSVLAEKPSWAGNGKHGDREERERGGDRRDDRYRERRDDRYMERRDDRGGINIDFHFGSDSRRIASEYYGAQARAGHCPPGLAKKNNGCMPPGQAKKWRRGYALPSDVRYYDVPRDLLMRLPPPPPQHRYVQVAGDILMIAVGTSMVVDAMEDLMR